MALEDKMETCEEIFGRLKSAIENLLRASQSSNSLQLPEITLETDLVDGLGLDSVEMLDLATAISQEFKINTAVPELFNVTKVDDIVRYIAKLKSKT